MSRFTIWQCGDWCCDTKRYVDRWWNVGIAPGEYRSRPSWADAMTTASRWSSE